jgi:hypothetical protein
LLTIALAFALIGSDASNAETVFSQDFESGLGSNETTFGEFRIDDTNTAVNNGTLMMGHQTVYGAVYSYYEVRLDLSSFEQVRLQFDWKAFFETHIGRFNLQASTCPINPPNHLISPVSGMTYITDDIHVFELGQTYFDTSRETAGTAVFDLSAFDLEPQVCIRFQFGADHTHLSNAGINFDNLQVTGVPLCFEIDAIDDQFDVINDGTTAGFEVLANEKCNGDKPISVITQAGDLVPDRGGVAITDGTRVRYTPASGFVGFEQFTYTARDAGLDGGEDPPAVDQDGARVVMNVLADIAPDAVDDAVTTLQNQAVVIDVLENDTLGNGATRDVEIVTPPENGTATLQADATIRYVPNFNFFGEDGFEYRLTDANGDSDVATVTVGVFFVRGSVPIDVMPNDAGNNLNLRSGPGSGFEVAILSDGVYFEAPNLIDPLSLKLGPRQANIWGDGRVRDVDGDGDEDLVVKFLTQQTGIACGDTQVNLSGRTFASQSISGSDAVNTFNCPRVRKRY